MFRTPYQYGGGYDDEVRAIINFGDRWYDPSREMIYSPDPVLTDDPMAIVSEPSLRAAYCVRRVERRGQRRPERPAVHPCAGESVHQGQQEGRQGDRGQETLRMRARIEANLQTRLPKSLVRLGLDIESADLHQKRFKMIDDIAKPFVEINVSTGEVQLSLGLFKQWPVRKGTEPADPSSPNNAANGTQDATNGNGGPATVSSAPGGAAAQDDSVAPARPHVTAPDTGKAPQPAGGNAPPAAAPKHDAGGTDAKGSL